PMTRLSRISTVAFFLILISSLASTAHAIRVQLPSAASVPLSTSYPDAAQKQVRSALANERCKFVDGVSVNAVSTLRFSGGTSAVNQQLKEIAKCPGSIVTVAFDRFERKLSWKVVLDSKTMSFKVTINLDSPNMLPEELVLPPARGPELHSPLNPLRSQDGSPGSRLGD
ncbi:MAG: hypothetical protein ACR2NZ_18645, partial [Rubripirellula sp.]